MCPSGHYPHNYRPLRVAALQAAWDIFAYTQGVALGCLQLQPFRLRFYAKGFNYHKTISASQVQPERLKVQTAQGSALGIGEYVLCSL